ncbi:MAG: CAP domain-containing protein [Thiolinea sp.]
MFRKYISGWRSGYCFPVCVLCAVLLQPVLPASAKEVDDPGVSGQLRNAPAVAYPGAAEHNVIRDALSRRISLHNLGFFLNESYDFSQQAEPEQALEDFQDSSVLQNSAAQHVQSCTFTHLNSSPYGQNLFAGTGTGWTIEHAVNSWANEVRYYDYNTGSCATGQQCGHYTQIIWANTRKVGCVIQQCGEMTDRNGNIMFGGQSGVMIFCHYDPPGNYINQKPYIEASTDPAVDLTVKIKVLLQGAYQAADNMMRATPAGWSVPLTEPYSSLGYNVSGTKQLNDGLLSVSGSNAIVDWMLVELRDADDPSLILESKALLVQRDGDLVDPLSGGNSLVFADKVSGRYHLAVRHRNHLGVMTRQPVALSASAVSVDFSSASTPVWGQNGRVDVGGRSLLWGGDVNHDGQVIAVGVGNDTGLTVQNVLTAAGNDGFSANFVTQGYKAGDTNLDSRMIAAGQGNDTNLILSNILLHPDNPQLNKNFVISQQLP